jgi:protein-tyrosine phosphatase
MIDLHCHILPFVDDGAKDLDVSVEMCRMAADDGITILAATPHFRAKVYENAQESILRGVKALQEILDRKGIGLEVVPGADMLVSPELIPFLEQNPRLLFGGRYALVEFPHQSIPPGVEEFFFRMQLKGFTPIISHPERNAMLQKNPQILESLVEKGALTQVTAMSVTGEFGEEVGRTVLGMVKSGLVHIVASDAHSVHRRVPILSKALRTLEKWIGPEKARMMVEETPRKILLGDPVEVFIRGEGQPPRPSIFRKLFGKR